MVSLRDQTIAQLPAQVAALTAERDTERQRAQVLNDIATRAAQERDHWKTTASDALDARDRCRRECNKAQAEVAGYLKTVEDVARNNRYLQELLRSAMNYVEDDRLMAEISSALEGRDEGTTDAG